MKYPCLAIIGLVTISSATPRLWAQAAETITAQTEAAAPQQGREISGRVVDDQGQPVADALVAGLGGAGGAGALRDITRTDADGRFKLSGLPEGSLAFVAGKGLGFVSIRTESNELPDLALREQPRGGTNLPGAITQMMQLVQATRVDATFPAAVLAGIAAPYDIVAAGQALVDSTADGQPHPEHLRRYYAQYIANNPENVRRPLVALLPELSGQNDDLGFPRFILSTLRVLPNPQDEVVPGDDADIAGLRSWVHQNYGAASQKAGTLDLTNDADDTMAVRLAWYAVLSSRLDDGMADTWADKAAAVVRRKAAPADDDRAAEVLKVLAQGGTALTERAFKTMTPARQAAVFGQFMPVLAKTDLAGARRLLEGLPAEAKTAFGPGAIAVLENMAAAHAAEALILAERVAEEAGKPVALALAAHLQPQPQAGQLMQQAFDKSLAQQAGAGQSARIVAHALDFDAALGLKLLYQLEERNLTSGIATEDLAAQAFLWARVDPARARVWLEWAWAREQAKPRGLNANAAACIAVAMAPASLARATQMAESIPPERKEPRVQSLTLKWAAQYRIAQWMALPEAQRRKATFSDFWPATDVLKEEVGW